MNHSGHPLQIQSLSRHSAEGYSKFAVGMAQLHTCAMGSSVGG